MILTLLPSLLVLTTLFFPLAVTVLEWAFWERGNISFRNPSRRINSLGYLTLSASLISLVLSAALVILVTERQIQLPYFVMVLAEPKIKFTILLDFFTFYVDALSTFFVFLLNVVAFVSSWSTVFYLDGYLELNRHASPLRFHALFNLFHFTMLLVAVVDNLVVLWIAVELTTLVSAMLVAYRGDAHALEAAWKYILITSTGIIFALLGTMFLANALPSNVASTATMNWSDLVELARRGALSENYVRLSFLFVLVGYGTKAGLAPMFTWLPDGHGEAPSPVSAMLSGVLLKSALYALLRFYIITNLALPEKDFTSNLLLSAGSLSLVMAVPFILKSNPFKRILAYHSLEHMGIIVFGIGLGGSVAIFGALLHALNHALTKALMFLTFGRIQDEFNKHGIPSDQIKGVLKVLPATSLILFLGGLALVGSPPFNIFMSEFIILWSALDSLSQATSPLRLLAMGIFLTSILFIFAGLIGHLGRMLLGPAPLKHVHERLAPLLPLIVLLIVILITGVTLVPLSSLLTRSVDIIRSVESP